MTDYRRHPRPARPAAAPDAPRARRAAEPGRRRAAQRAGGSRRRASGRGALPASVTLWSGVLSAVALGVFMAVAGWQRRWIADDGLIVLRTVNNLLEGNGPVFNAGERVEANTSTLWQYLIAATTWVTTLRPDQASLWLALLLSVAAVVIGALAAWRLHTHRMGSPMVLIAPAGLLIYVMLPPARDFATSGLEWGLSIFWLAVLFALLVDWVTRDFPIATPPDATAFFRAMMGLGLLSFWAGLSWLVRPELALYGGITGLVLIAHTLRTGAGMRWRIIAWILLWALPVPAGYQLFRMAYYGLLVPHTAVAKSASDTAWGTGWTYLNDLMGPYNLWVMLSLLIVTALAGRRLVSIAQRSWDDPELAPHSSSSRTSAPHSPLADAAPAPRGLRRPATVVAILLGCGLLHVLYVLRVGGDFMHGRMLLIPLFALLLPLAVMPLCDLRIFTRIDDVAADDGPRAALSLPTALVAAGVISAIVWSGITIAASHQWNGTEVIASGELGIVDEREFWTITTKSSREDPPLTPEDYLSAPVIDGYEDVLDATAAEHAATGAILPIARNDNASGFGFIRVPADPALQQTPNGFTYDPTVFVVNLGVAGTIAPLDVRVLDPIGLANPLAARTPRLPEGRIGHDKALPTEWQLADTDVDSEQLPGFVNRERVLQVRELYATEPYQRLFASYRAPLTWRRALANVKFALTTGRSFDMEEDFERISGAERREQG